MNKPFILIIVLLFNITLNSCTTHKYHITGSHCDGRCTYVKTAVGYSFLNNFLFLKQNPYNRLLYTAKENLYKTFPLQKGEFYDNFTVDAYYKYYLIGKSATIVVRADIVTHEPIGEKSMFGEVFIQEIGMLPENNIFQRGDSVVFKRGKNIKYGVLLDLHDNKTLVHYKHNGLDKFKYMPLKNIFFINNEELEEICNCEINQIIEYTATKNNNIKIKKIIGLQIDKYLIIEKQGNKIHYKTISAKK